MEILAHALAELHCGRIPALCSKFKVSFSAGTSEGAGDAGPEHDGARRDPCVVIESVMEEVDSGQRRRRSSDSSLALGDCLQRVSPRKKIDLTPRASSLMMSTARRLCRRGYTHTAVAADSNLDALDTQLKDTREKPTPEKKAHYEKGASKGEPVDLDTGSTSGSSESVELSKGFSHKDYVLQAQVVFETYWKGNLRNILEVLKELSERGSAELGWKRQGKLQDFTKAVSRVWQRVGEQVTTITGDMLSRMEPQGASPQPDFVAHELLPLLLRIREVWWLTQRHVAGNFLSLYQKYENSSEQWLMAMREVDVHLLRTAMLHREIMESELLKIAKMADRELETGGCSLRELFIREGVGYWLAEHLDLIWSEFGNQVQKGVVSLYKAFDSPSVRAWATLLEANGDQVANAIRDAWISFSGRVQEGRRSVVEEVTTDGSRREEGDQDDNEQEPNSVLHRIHVYTRILRHYEEMATNDWQEAYRETFAILDEAFSASGAENVIEVAGTPETRGAYAAGLPLSASEMHIKVTLTVTKIWEGVMVEIRHSFKECRSKFEKAILVDYGP
ncbi:uncharacterized protein LOC144146514 [Haemaphysalis longicornis]